MSSLDQPPAPPPGGGSNTGGGRNAGMPATVTSVPDSLKKLDAPVRLTGTVTGRGEGGTTRIETQAGTLRVTPSEPLPKDARVSVRLQAGEPPDRARIALMDKQSQARAAQEAAAAGRQAKARAAEAVRQETTTAPARQGGSPEPKVSRDDLPPTGRPETPQRGSAGESERAAPAPDRAAREAAAASQARPGGQPEGPGNLSPATRSQLLERVRPALPQAARPAAAEPGTTLVAVLVAGQARGEGTPQSASAPSQPGLGQAPSAQPATQQPASQQAAAASAQPSAGAATSTDSGTDPGRAGQAGETARTAALARQLDLARQLVARAPQAAQAVAQTLAGAGVLAGTDGGEPASPGPATGQAAQQAPSAPSVAPAPNRPGEPFQSGQPAESRAPRPASGQAGGQPSPHGTPTSAAGHAREATPNQGRQPGSPASQSGADRPQTGQTPGRSAPQAPSPATVLAGNQANQPVGLRLLAVAPPGTPAGGQPAGAAAGQGQAAQNPAGTAQAAPADPSTASQPAASQSLAAGQPAPSGQQASGQHAVGQGQSNGTGAPGGSGQAAQQAPAGQPSAPASGQAAQQAAAQPHAPPPAGGAVQPRPPQGANPAPPPQPAGPAGPPGSVAPPTTPTGGAAPPPMAAGPESQVTGTVLGRSAEGLTLVRLGGGDTLAVDFRESPTPGTRLTFQLLDRASTEAALSDRNSAAAALKAASSSNHPALKTALATLAEQGPPTAMTSAAGAIPRPGGEGLAGALMKVLRAMRPPQPGQPAPSASQALGQMLGGEAVQALQRSSGGGELLGRLWQEVGGNTGTATDNSGAEWRWHGLPLAGLDRWDHFHLYLRRDGGQDPHEQDADDEGAQRFVIDMQLSQWGQTQIEGLLRGDSLTMTLRTEAGLDQATRQEMQQLYRDTLEALGLNGSLTFQRGEDGRWLTFQLSEARQRRGVTA